MKRAPLGWNLVNATARAWKNGALDPAVYQVRDASGKFS